MSMSFVTILTAWVGRTFPVHPAFTYASMALSAYPLLICAFRYSINEMCYSKHESPLLYVATANGVLSYVTFQGGTLVTLAIALVLTLASYRFAVIGPVPKDVDMKGRVCIVTGSSSGIGQATAQALVRMGAHVILACRSEKKALQARDEIRAACAGSKGKAEFMQLDLASFSSVRAFAAAFQKKGLPLHVLVNNAGVMQHARLLTEDGNEMTLQANYLGHALLTNMLLPALKASAAKGGARIVNISSSMHWGEKRFDFDDMQGERRYGMFRQYERSKLAQLISTVELSRRLEGSGVTVNAVHPGSVVTNVTSGFHPLLRLGERFTTPLQYAFRKPRDAGAHTAVHCASSPKVREVSGKYFWHCREEYRSPLVDDRETQRRLWEVTEKLLARGAGKKQ